MLLVASKPYVDQLVQVVAKCLQEVDIDTFIEHCMSMNGALTM